MNEQAVEYLQDDPHLRPVINEHGPVTIEPADDLFQRMVVSIIRQQVSMESAAATRERLYNTVDVEPTTILETDTDTLHDVGLSQQKASYIHNIAEAFLENNYSRQYFDGMNDEEVMNELTEIKGVGPWTARMQLIFGLGREDVFPVGDLGIRKGMQSLYGEDTTRAEMRDIAGHWQPYRSYASLYVWRAYEG
ncbi:MULTISPECIES: DNA-3-methyladenine glycosylase [Halobacterium]|uniref:DNA-3-methyladenine glycosylase family protein n=1 Tax=Halobacterium TaxID=2239 RepID=UPI00073EF4CF|nr:MULTISPECIES: DNA-3-methyladenine glycosylase [Halobacterium]MCG1003300.1 DNA-3-methyladenine glycosylase [Halobacterium noricense]